MQLNSIDSKKKFTLTESIEWDKKYYWFWLHVQREALAKNSLWNTIPTMIKKNWALNGSWSYSFDWWAKVKFGRKSKHAVCDKRQHTQEGERRNHHAQHMYNTKCKIFILQLCRFHERLVLTMFSTQILSSHFFSSSHPYMSCFFGSYSVQ